MRLQTGVTHILLAYVVKEMAAHLLSELHSGNYRTMRF
jgi:hypothetical protein